MLQKSTFMKWLVVLTMGLFISLPFANAQYCAGGPTSTADSNVTNVTLNGESQNITHTGCPGVAGLQNLTYKIADLIPGNTYTVSVTWGTCGGTYAGAGSVWIDWNGNQVYEASEVIGTWTGSPTVTSNYNFTVPANAAIGSTRMRVMQRESGVLPLDPCATYTWGSNMDFGIEILASGDGIVTGTVTDVATGNPLIGALVSIAGEEIITLENGAFYFEVSATNHQLVVSKPGFNTYTETLAVGAGETVVRNVELYENANVPGVVLAELNAGATAVNLTWGLPSGQYHIIYDDGVAENVTAWGLSGNMNALRFTPAGYPAKVIAGSVNIYDGTYPPSGNALVPFQMAVYDATGPAGYPGNELGVVTVTPNSFGWVDFDLSDLNVTITSGDFYLVMIQGGNFPNCAPIAIDQTNPVMRSYSRFVTGGAPWTPAGFNDFMMRAIVEGPGGPNVLSYGAGELVESGWASKGAMSLYEPQRAVAEIGMGIFKPIAGTGTIDRSVEGYRVYRLVEGQEGNEAAWTMVGNPTNTALVDNSWPNLPDGAYRWAVKAKYPLNVYSEPAFSNVLRKNWASNVTINITLSDPEASIAGTEVTLTNNNFPQYTYTATAGASGVVNFQQVWKGSYTLNVYLFGYNPYTSQENITTNTYTKNVMLMETTNPPSNLVVNPVTLMATWNVPSNFTEFFADFNSGIPSDWTVINGGTCAATWQGVPNYGGSSSLNGTPFVLADSDGAGSGCGTMDEQLITPAMNTLGASAVILEFDQYYRALGDIADVDVWNGSSWVNVLRQTTTSGAWGAPNHRVINISAHSNAELKVRFHYYNANWAWYWAIDNVRIHDGTSPNRSVIGYYVYLDNVLAGFTEEPFFQFQPDYIEYGQTYTAGVRAVYQSGFSPMITYVFTSEFLYPPCNLQGEDADHAVSLTWESPGLCDPFGGSGGGGGGGTGELYEIKYHNGVPADAYYQQFNYGYGVVFNVAAYSNVTVEKLDYRHSPWGINGTWNYKIHVVDWNTYTLLYTTPVLQSTVNNGWELDIPLNSIPQSGLVGIFLEPMGNVANDAYPCLDGDAVATSSSLFGPLPNWSGMSNSGPVGNFLMDLWIMADPMDGGERQLVKAPVLENTLTIEAENRNPNAYVAQPTLIPASLDPNHVSMPVKGKSAAMNMNIRADVGYGWNAYAAASGIPEGPVTVAIPAGTLTSIQAVPSSFWMAGGDWANGVWYTVDYSAANNSGFYTVDHTTGNYSLIGPTGYGMTGLAYDVTTQTMYASGYTGTVSNLYTINMATGAATLVGQTTAGIIIGIACDANGNLYGLDLVDDNLYSINKTTGAGTVIGPIGYNVNYAQDIGFDRDANVLYGALYTTSGGFYTINTTTGQASFINNFIAEVCALAIPYTTGGGGGGSAIPTAGFNVYRNGSLLATVDGETFEFVDQPLIAGTYSYSVTALYDYNGGLVESQHEGPISVTVAPGLGFVNGVVYDEVTFQPIGGVEITCGEFSTVTQPNGTFTLVAHEGQYDICFDKIGYALHCQPITIVWQQTQTLNVGLTPQEPNFPFEETWSSGSFATQGWTFVPSQGNWRMSSTAGNPAPSAEFYWSPSLTNYSFALTSVEIDARAATQNVTLTYSIFLDNFSATAQEKMTVEIWNGTEWVFVAEHKNDNAIPWTTHNIDVTQHAAGKMTRIRFRANGANTFNINWWYLDNIKLHQVLPPQISVNPTSMTQALQQGLTATQTLTVSNIGAGAMNFSTQIEYLDKSNEFTVYPVEPGEKVVISGMELSSAPNHIPGGEPVASDRNEVILNYDGPNFDAIGLTSGGTFHVAARFPSSMVGQYAGYVLTSVDVYINNVPSAATLKIWGAGTGTAPGAVLHQQTFSSTASSWVTITLTNGVVLDGTDIWVGYQVTHGAGQYPAGCDAGPANPNGDWISIDGVAWEHLAGYGLNYNWNIRAKLNPGAGLWLNVSPNSGNVAPGASLPLTVTFDAAGLEVRAYHANIKVNSNDPNTPQVIIPVTLDVLVGINEVDREAVMVYPVPANDVLNIVTTQGISNVRMFSYTGQLVYEANVTGETTLNIDVKPFHSGAYILQFITSDGQVFNRQILISR